MGLDATNSTVYDLLNDKMYLIPVNQRKYVWNDNNWQEFWEDIDLVYKENITNHFIGSIVLEREKSQEGIRNCFSIIDGQQRITTITIFFAVLAFVYAKNHNKEYFAGLNKPLFVRDDKNESHPILSEKANADVSLLVEKIFKHGNQCIENSTEMVSLKELFDECDTPAIIKKCFQFFYDKITVTADKDMQIVKKFQSIVIDIRYIDIVAENDEDAYTIFEILNARGQALTDFELLRNFLLKYASKDQKDGVHQKLKDISSRLGDAADTFLSHYVIHKYGIKTNKNNMRPYKVIVSEEKAKSKEDLLNDLDLKSKYYSKILMYDGCSPLEKKIFSFFKPRRQQQFRPLVLSLMHQLDLGALSLEKYEENMQFLYEFFICYHLIGEQNSNKIQDVVHKYSKDIENQFSLELLDNFKKSMTDRIPNEQNFCNSIKNIRFSNHWKAYSDNRKRENVRAIFEVLERELGYKGDFSGCNIEHCYPDSASEENCQIGNMMLLEKPINDKCDSKTLAQKIGYYKDSALVLPSQIEPDFSIADRNEWIAKKLHSYISSMKK